MVLLLIRSVFIYFSNNFSGEQWETTYGESSWRMAVLAMCLPETVNRFVLVNFLTIVKVKRKSFVVALNF